MMRRPMLFTARALVALPLSMMILSGFDSSAHAGWPNSPFTNLPVCTAPGLQQAPRVTSDGSGGAIVVWHDYRAGAWDIYAQHVLPSGSVDPAWPVDGRALCTAVNAQQYPMLVADGTGGAIVTWQDSRSGNPDIYAQHLLASGAVDPAWPVNGRALCTAANFQQYPTILSDGLGGAIVTWQDSRIGQFDIYAQHVLASGTVDALWPADGRQVCSANNDQTGTGIVSDGAGGALIMWNDLRALSISNVYVQRVQASGAVDPAWPVNGRPVCPTAYYQRYPTMVSDAAGGAIITWQEFSNGNNWDIYGGHVLSSGATDPAWPACGLAVCIAGTDQLFPESVSDGAGGAIVTWQDKRSGEFNIYAQRLLVSGTADPAWPNGGRNLCLAANDQQYPILASDGAGGAVVSWQDMRSGNNDIYATHVGSAGAVDGNWPLDGRALCTAGRDQKFPVILSDGIAGAIVAWQDSRYSSDIYAQRVAPYSYLGTPEAEIVGVQDVANDQGGSVKLSFKGSYLEAAPYNLVTMYQVFRLVGSSWNFSVSIAPDFLSNYSVTLPTAADSTTVGTAARTYRVLTLTAGSAQWNSVPKSGYSVDNLAPGTPAPFTGEYISGTARLHWNRNSETDLAGYRLYRGTSSSFVPGPGNLLAALPDTGYADPAGGLYVYKLTAVDVHGNQSPVATLAPGGTVAVDDPFLPRELSFAPPLPNPAWATSLLHFALPHPAPVRLAVYDAGGRLVRVLASGGREAGDHAEAWDLRDAAGRTAPAGLYFARLEVEGRVLTQRVAVVR